jgi:hypothetical protein
MNLDLFNTSKAIVHLHNAVEQLEQAGRWAVGGRDEPLFKEIHESRMKLVELICKLMGEKQ